MSRYIPVRTTMDSEDHYHSPYDTHELDSDQHYEAPTCLKRNPSGSLFIPSGEDRPSMITKKGSYLNLNSPQPQTLTWMEATPQGDRLKCHLQVCLYFQFPCSLSSHHLWGVCIDSIHRRQ